MLGDHLRVPWLVIEYRQSPSHRWRPVTSRYKDLEEAYDALLQLWGPRTEIQMYIPQDVAARHEAFDVEGN